MQQYFVELIKAKLESLYIDENTIVVLKCFSKDVLETFGCEAIDLQAAVKNKIMYFASVISKRKYITYEEYLLLATFIREQFNNVYIVNNNLFMNKCPLNVYFDEETKNNLLNHYLITDDDSQDDLPIGNIDKYVEIYDDFQNTNGQIVGAYCALKAGDETGVTQVNIIDSNVEKLTVKDNAAQEILYLNEENDFISLVLKAESLAGDVFIDINGYVGDRFLLEEHLAYLASVIRDRASLYFVSLESEEEGYNSRKEFTQILKKYWGYDSFRELQVYNLKKLNDGKEREIVSISQERIIANLTDEAEKASNNQSYRDLFVTAPTGSGKSVMFQIPAIYLAEKYNYLTIVISPLIGLMNDQVYNLSKREYKYVETINSDLSNIVKEAIRRKVAENKIHILYISPETLLSRSDITSLIGDRTIGMVIVDEAHIVTTWGKQFRPDYWYLGDYIRKLRRERDKKFVVATFTATAIYHGFEDMYSETLNSLHMINPITYLGYVRRNDIKITINRLKPPPGKPVEYELDKFDEIMQIANEAVVTCKKTLIYFPTVALINRCEEFLRAQNPLVAKYLAVYHGALSKDRKSDAYEGFKKHYDSGNPDSPENEGIRFVMLATKAFGMGVDIDDIEKVVHFAPTGNVCDYVQEIGRSARKEGLNGEAYYHYNSRDFKHINRLHGLSSIRKSQLIEVISKIVELYKRSLAGNGGRPTRKRHSMLLDAENFAYIFGDPRGDEDNTINKVKTALLMIQKDYENQKGYSPIYVKPIPMFANGYFQISSVMQEKIANRFPGCVSRIDTKFPDICKVNLKRIWEQAYHSMSFQKFKYLLYTKSDELSFNKKFDLTAALQVKIDFQSNAKALYKRLWGVFENIIYKHVEDGKYVSVNTIAMEFKTQANIEEYKARSITEVIIASMDSFRKRYMKQPTRIVQEMSNRKGEITYCFFSAVNQYFAWVSRRFDDIIRETIDGELYLIDNANSKAGEFSTVLGVLEAMDVLSFEMLGGANSQLYIYVTQIQHLINILSMPKNYDNKLLNRVYERHLLAVKMLTYIYESDFSSDEVWDILEDYFLGNVPEMVKIACHREKPNITFD